MRVKSIILLLMTVLFGTPVYAAESLYYYHNDHLGTPQIMTAENQAVVWHADYRPFGQVSGSANIVNNLRFPGQYYDQESGLRYNYFREYDPAAGRYMQSDPIGLEGGINTYAYVGGNPIRRIDIYGLFDAAITDSPTSGGSTYGGSMTITGDGGQSVTVPVSTWPNPGHSNPGIASGVYEGPYSLTGHQGTDDGIRLENGGFIPTNGPNPAQNGQNIANGINIHCGYSSTNRGSAGCLTIDPDYCLDVWNVLSPGETGTVTIIRP